MPKRKTIDEVRQRIFELSNGTTELLSTEYVNSGIPLKLKCGKCGKIFERDFEHINRGRIWCEKCSHEIASEKNRFSLDHVIDIIRDHGCEYVQGDYKNSDSKLLIKCSCGNIFEKSLKKFTSGQDRCPECGHMALIKAKTKYTAEDAKYIFSQKGYKIIGEYKNAYTPVECLCQNGHKCQLILSQFLQHCSGCNQCAIEARSGRNHWNYKGGISLLEDNIRQALTIWKNDIRNCYKVCPISGEYGINADIHHLISLSTIFQEAVVELDIDIESKRTKISDFVNETEYKELLNKIVQKHDFYSGILISKEIHVLFHREYGYGHNTLEQFDEFLKQYYKISLKDIQEKYVKGG